jgi:hypothetical protein
MCSIKWPEKHPAFWITCLLAEKSVRLRRTPRCRLQSLRSQLVELGPQVTSGGGAARAVFLASAASGTVSGRRISAVSNDFPAC